VGLFPETRSPAARLLDKQGVSPAQAADVVAHRGGTGDCAARKTGGSCRQALPAHEIGFLRTRPARAVGQALIGWKI